MQTISELNIATPPPAHHFLSLGWRLALSTTLIISLVMGGISVSQQLIDLKNERKVRQELLQMSLTPLVARLESADTLNTMQRYVDEFHEAYAKKNYPVHHLMLNDDVGQQVISTIKNAVAVPTANNENKDYFRTDISIVSPLLGGGRGSMVVMKDSTEYSDAVRRSWVFWLVHFAVTVGTVFFFLVVITYFQVTKPVNQLLQAVKKMEQGYWGPINISKGAWEVRWLAWRFSNMVQEVQNTMKYLFEAERKSRSVKIEPTDTVLQDSLQVDTGDSIPQVVNFEDTTEYRKLIAVCEELESGSSKDAQTVQLAQRVKQREVLEASQLGFYQLKSRMEDAAFRLIDPITYSSLDERLSTYKTSWHTWAEQLRHTMQRNLAKENIPYVGILHRVKHTAGVWAKMQDKDLDVDEVYDLFAFRIIVPTEADCYAALAVIHYTYTPEASRFKDYIAKPKGNGYRSIHTCVKTEDGPIFEVQIRSVAMDRQAERGGAAHWLYKKDGPEIDDESTRLNWWDKIQKLLRSMVP